MHRAAVHELRLVVTVADLDEAIHLYRDVLGLPERPAVGSPAGRVAILDVGHATLELADEAHATYVDEVEVGRRSAGHIRVAFGVDDVDTATRDVAEAGGVVLAAPTPTPWGSINARIDAAGGLQLTLFEAQGPDGG